MSIPICREGYSARRARCAGGSWKDIPRNYQCAGFPYLNVLRYRERNLPPRDKMHRSFASLRMTSCSSNLAYKLSTKLLGEQFVHQLWIGLPLGKLHNLTDEETQHCGFARAILLELPGIRRENFINDLLDGREICDLLRLLVFVDFGKILLARKAEVIQVLENL